MHLPSPLCADSPSTAKYDLRSVTSSGVAAARRAIILAIRVPQHRELDLPAVSAADGWIGAVLVELRRVRQPDAAEGVDDRLALLCILKIAQAAVVPRVAVTPHEVFLVRLVSAHGDLVGVISAFPHVGRGHKTWEAKGVV